MVGCAEGDAVAVAYDQHLLIRDREAALCLRRRRLRRRRRSLRRCCGRGSRRRYRQGRRRCRGGRRRGAANAPVFRASAGRKHRRHDPEGDTERGAAAERRGHRARLTAPRVAPRRDGEIGRRDGLKIRWAKHPWGFESPSRYQGDPVSAATSTETSRAPHRIQRGTSLPTGPNHPPQWDPLPRLQLQGRGSSPPPGTGEIRFRPLPHGLDARHERAGDHVVADLPITHAAPPSEARAGPPQGPHNQRAGDHVVKCLLPFGEAGHDPTDPERNQPRDGLAEESPLALPKVSRLPFRSVTRMPSARLPTVACAAELSWRAKYSHQPATIPTNARPPVGSIKANTPARMKLPTATIKRSSSQAHTLSQNPAYSMPEAGFGALRASACDSGGYHLSSEARHQPGPSGRSLDLTRPVPEAGFGALSASG